MPQENRCPADGRALVPVRWTEPSAVAEVVARCRAAQPAWAALPLATRQKRITLLGRRI
ncbi:MAG: hypothetical protein KC656_11335, partial [Myxococcales bacterium]|nr:hypothetical protein [Myxococcales bacterium]